jgi:hypothetical protein
MNCSGVAVVLSWRWIVDMSTSLRSFDQLGIASRPSKLGDFDPAYGVSSKSLGRSENILDRGSFEGRVVRAGACGAGRLLALPDGVGIVS